MRAFQALIVIAVAVGSSAVAIADAPGLGQPSPIQGNVDQLMVGPDGRPDGLLLQDNTVIRFNPASLRAPAPFRRGELISGNGVQVLTSPNKVFNHVTLRKGDVTVVDESQRGGPPSPPVDSSARAVSRFKSIEDSSSVLAMSARDDGKIDRLILKDGTTAQVPDGAWFDPLHVGLGEKVSASGVGASFPGAKFIEVFNARGPDAVTPIKAPGESGEKWKDKSGELKQALVNPQGQVDGILLADGSAIRFAPQPAPQMAQLKPGSPVRAAGPGINNQVRALTPLVVEQYRVVALDPTPPPTAAAGQAAPGPAPLSPMSDSAQVQFVLRSPKGELDMLILSDGANVRITPDARKGLVFEPKPGDRVNVTGRGGKYPLGTGIEADSVRIVNRA